MADKYQYTGGSQPPPYDAATSGGKTQGAPGYYSQGGYHAQDGNTSAQPSDRMGGSSGLAFTEQSVRLGFIKKVYGILTIQLLATAGIVALFILVEPIKVAVKGNLLLLISAFLVALIVILVLACCEAPRRSFPTNLILLGVFTLAIGVVLGVFSAFASTEAVLIALGITCIIVFALTLFAMLSKWDFTWLVGIMFCVLISLLIFGILVMFMRSRILIILYGTAGALIFSIYLVIDTQMMLGGNHKYTLSEEEYIFAALNLYLDVINIFMYILMIIMAGHAD